LPASSAPEETALPHEYPRARRVEEQLKRLLSELVRREVKDPRVGLVTITSAEVSNDLTHATIYFTPFAGEGDASAALEALQHASGFLRHQVRNQMRLRVAPELVFRIDDSVERGARLSALIHDAVESDRRRHAEPDSEEE
jgi:ribosome-binding factor A